MNIQVVNRTAAVLKLAGNINKVIARTGAIIGKKALLKSLMISCFRDRERATKSINASFAKSLVWKVILMTGSVIQRLASLICEPKTRVKNNIGMAMKSEICAILE